MILDKPHIVLIALCVFIPLAFITTYAVSVGNKHVNAFFPYISDTGTIPPASCLFGQFLDIGALMFLYISYVRYLHVKEYVKTKGLIRANKSSLVFGIISSFSITVIGNFQETNVGIVHSIGAIAGFVSLIIYVWINTVLSQYLTEVRYGGVKVFIFRLMLCIFGTTTLILAFTFTIVAIYKYDGDAILLWKPEDAGYSEYLAGSINEWFLALSVVIVLFTFIPEFKRFKLKMPNVEILNNNKKNTEDDDVQKTNF